MTVVVLSNPGDSMLPPEEPFLPSTNLSGPRSGKPGSQQRPLSSAEGQRGPSRSPLGFPRAPIAFARRPGPAATPASATAGKSRSATRKSTRASRDAGAGPGSRRAGGVREDREARPAAGARSAPERALPDRRCGASGGLVSYA